MKKMCKDERGPHPFKRGMATGVSEKDFMGLLHHRGQTEGGDFFLKGARVKGTVSHCRREIREGIYDQSASNLSALMTSHTVGHGP
jgi:hypothetical protein